MLYWLLFETLFPHFSPFRVFSLWRHPDCLASFDARFLSIVLGPWLIGSSPIPDRQHIREEGRSRTEETARPPWAAC